MDFLGGYGLDAFVDFDFNDPVTVLVTVQALEVPDYPYVPAIDFDTIVFVQVV
jgi:hypothetical protein